MSDRPVVTLDDIAERAGVSTAAVSQALSGKGTLAQATRERILKVVEELAYRPDQMAQNLALRRASRAYGQRRGRASQKPVPPPGVMVFYNLAELTEVLLLEMQQMEEEGYQVQPFRQAFAAWKKPAKHKLYRLYNDVLGAPRRPDYPYVEPTTLAEIQAARPDGPRRRPLSLNANRLYEKIHGAWLGRAAGCVLGKPIQAGWSKRQVARYLELAGCQPLDNYLPRIVPLPAGFEFQYPSAGHFLGEVNGAPADDDTDFTVLALHLLETAGLDFRTDDVATEWLNHIAYFAMHTTERAVYRNLVWNVHPDEAAAYVNPEREFIGGRARADLYGWAAPGNPQLAAALAYKDAALSHTKNGVYSAMMTAAMLAWGFVTGDVAEWVRVGLSEIPANCRLAEAVRAALALYEAGSDWELSYEQLILTYGAYSPIHTINNTLWMVLALLHGGGDFDRTLALAVGAGMDTGSNAASAGSLAGLLVSSAGIPARWTAPLNDTLYTGLAQFQAQSIQALAGRTAALARMTLTA